MNTTWRNKVNFKNPPSIFRYFTKGFWVYLKKEKAQRCIMYFHGYDQKFSSFYTCVYGSRLKRNLFSGYLMWRKSHISAILTCAWWHDLEKIKNETHACTDEVFLFDRQVDVKHSLMNFSGRKKRIPGEIKRVRER